MAPLFHVRAQCADKRNREQSENQSLHHCNQQFQEIKWQGSQPERGIREHDGQHTFASVNITIKTHGQRHGPDADRNHFNQTDKKED